MALYIFSCVTNCLYQNKVLLACICIRHHITYLSSTFRTLTLIYWKNVAYHTGANPTQKCLLTQKSLFQLQVHCLVISQKQADFLYSEDWFLFYMLPCGKTSFKACWPGGIVLSVISFALMSIDGESKSLKPFQRHSLFPHLLFLRKQNNTIY